MYGIHVHRLHINKNDSLKLQPNMFLKQREHKMYWFLNIVYYMSSSYLCYAISIVEMLYCTEHLFALNSNSVRSYQKFEKSVSDSVDTIKININNPTRLDLF